MTYELKYKCDFKGTPGFDMPYITYKYRPAGKLFWIEKCTEYIDRFAYLKWDRFYDRYYEDMPLYTRAYILRTILNEKYNGNLESYVKDIVEFWVMDRLIEIEKDTDTLDICMSFVTKGWRSTTVDITKTEEKTGA